MKEQDAPIDEQMERAVLGSILCDSRSMDTARGRVDVSDFRLELHQHLWRRLCGLYDNGTPIEMVTVTKAIEGDSLFRPGETINSLVEMQEGLPRPPNIERYIQSLKTTSLRWRAVTAAEHLRTLAMSRGTTAEQILDEFSAMSAKLAEASGGSEKGPISTCQLIEKYGLDELLNPRRQQGLQLPWANLDRALGGFRSEQMIALMAATSHGKTSAALEIAAHAALQGKTPVIWTLEMSPEAMFRRMVTQLTGVYGTRLTHDERQLQMTGVARLNDHPIWFDRHSRSVSSFCATLRRVRATSGLGIAIVDYLQLISRSAGGRSTRAEEVSNDSRLLKMASVDLKIPVLVLSQVDRGSVKNGGKIGLHSAKESGDIENDADVVMWVEGPPVFNPEDTEVEMFIGKQREGRKNFGVKMIFRGSTQTFLEVRDGDV